MKKVIVPLVTALVSILVLLGIILGIVLATNNKSGNKNLKLKDNKGNTILELGKYKVSKYDEYKNPSWCCSFAIESHDSFLNFMKSTSCYDESLCFDCRNIIDTIDIDTHEVVDSTTFLRTIGYVVKDDFLFVYEINETYASLELVVDPFKEYLDDNHKVVREGPYFVCDMHMYLETMDTIATCWRAQISFDGIKNIYGKLKNITVDINESEKSITVYTVDLKTNEINKNQKIKMTFRADSFISYSIVE